MRTLLSAIVGLAAASNVALADQTDPRLDMLFKELRTGEAVRAEENIARIIAIWSDAQSDTVDLLFARAEESIERGKNELALTLLDHVVGLAPNFAQGYALRGVVRSRLDDSVGAIEDFSKVLELEPRHFDIRINLAQMLLASGAEREAYEMYQKALEWNPHDEHARRQARVLRRELEGQEI